MARWRQWLLGAGCCAAVASAGAQPEQAAPGLLSINGTSAIFDAATTLQNPRPALSLALGARAQLVYEPRLWRAQDAPGAGFRNRDAGGHLSLHFKSPRGSGPRNLLRLQLSGGGVMQFRPRGGGLTVRYQSQF